LPQGCKEVYEEEEEEEEEKERTFQTFLDAEGSPVSFLLATRLKRGMIEEEQEEEEKEDKSK